MDLPQDPAPAGLVTARKTVEYFLISAPSSDQGSVKSDNLGKGQTREGKDSKIYRV